MDNLPAKILSKKWLEQWRTPQEFFRATEECLGKFEPDESLGRTDLQHLRDAYVVGLFARILNDHFRCWVRLASDKFPDAQVKCDDHTLDIEVTMADEKNRRMVQEHRQWREQRERGMSTTLPIDPIRDKELALEALPRVCRAKAKKYLGTEESSRSIDVALLIYLNFSTLLGCVLSDQEIIKLTTPWKNNFESIWILAGARAFRAWPSPAAYPAASDPFA